MDLDLLYTMKLAIKKILNHSKKKHTFPDIVPVNEAEL